MSDITKKIFSIEQEGPVRSLEPTKSDILRPMLVDGDEALKIPKAEDVPEFVTREKKQPLSQPPQLPAAAVEPETTSAAGWLIAGFGLLYLIGAGLYFGQPLFNKTGELFSVAGLILILALPIILLFLLWRTLRHLNTANRHNARVARATEILVSPDGEALSRTQTLATGIQSEIKKVNTSLADTVGALKDVQLSVTRETQSLDAAGLQLTSRSDDVGRNLTLQRQALESISGTFDTRMGTLSTHITETGDTLDAICVAAEEKLLKASESLQVTTGKMDQTVAEGSSRISERITEIGEISVKLEETTIALNTDLGASVQTLADTDQGLMDKSLALQDLNNDTQTRIIDLQNTIDQGNQMIAKLQDAAESRNSFVQSYYQDLSAGLKQSENETLAAQGKTARMVESNLAQMRRDFTSMETDLKALQTKLDDLKVASAPVAMEQSAQAQQARLKLEPLESDFPPVEPPRFALTPRAASKPALEPVVSKPALRPASKIDTPMNLGPMNLGPMNLGADMEIESADAAIVDYNPDVIQRPGDVSSAPKTKSKGFGRKTDKSEKSAWRWRDMLGTLDRPDGNLNAGTALVGTAAAGAATAAATSLGKSSTVDAVEILNMLQLSPAAVVDEGTVIDATQARINGGEAGLVTKVAEKLPEPINHLRDKMAGNMQLINNLRRFSDDFADVIGNTPPTAPALRAALGSPDGRAYLLAVTALKA